MIENANKVYEISFCGLPLGAHAQARAMGAGDGRGIESVRIDYRQVSPRSPEKQEAHPAFWVTIADSPRNGGLHADSRS